MVRRAEWRRRFFKNGTNVTANPLAVSLISGEVFRPDAFKSQNDRDACFKNGYANFERSKTFP